MKTTNARGPHPVGHEQKDGRSGREGFRILDLSARGARSRRWLLLAAGALTVVLLAVACGGGGSGGGGADGRLSGTVTVDGSSTVFPISEAMAEEFMKLNDTRVLVGVSGTGGGFQKFCADETDISAASRPIKDGEREDCAANGIELLELRIGLDGLAVVTHLDTDFLDFLTLDELGTLWAPEAEDTVTRWNQVRDSFPDEQIELFGPDTDSGTFDFFTEVVNGESGASRGDYTPSTDDNVLVIGITGSESALAYFGFAYYTENAARLRIVPIDAGNGPVAPSNETVSDGSYPLSRPLFIYVNTESLTEKPQVREFVRFYLSDEGMSLVQEVGYTSIPLAELDGSRAALEAAIGVGGG